jgi:hypothetical protein
LVQCEIVAIDNEVKDLLFDLQVITDMAKVLIILHMILAELSLIFFLSSCPRNQIVLGKPPKLPEKW